MDIKTKMKYMDSLGQAIKSDEIDKVKDLLTREPELIHSKTRSGGTLLHDASECGTPQMAELLLSMGVDITAESPVCGTALACAGTPQMAEFLMAHGMSPFLDIADKRNPLFYSISLGNGEQPMIKYWFNYEKDRLSDENQNRLCDKVYEQLKIRGNKKMIKELGLEDYAGQKENSKSQAGGLDPLEDMLYQCTKKVYKLTMKIYGMSM